MKVLVTGSNGFIGKNLTLHLKESSDFELLTFNRDDTDKDLEKLVFLSDFIIHLAGSNRPNNIDEYFNINTNLTQKICSLIKKTKRNIPIILSSSTQAEEDNDYGQSKYQAEEALKTLAQETNNPCIIYRFPGVFGKWCKPNYNSVVATFCHNISRSLKVSIHDPDKELKLIYIDDLISSIVDVLNSKKLKGIQYNKVLPEYCTSVGHLKDQISQFKESRLDLSCDQVGVGFKRALYSTYISYLPKKDFAYDIPSHNDERGNFVEMLKTSNCGQFSYFTAKPGIIRGEHYHHTKTELFLVIKGSAEFNFRNIITNEKHHIITNGNLPQVVQTSPGWTHNIINIGKSELIVMLWANEVFQKERPDTISSKI